MRCVRIAGVAVMALWLTPAVASAATVEVILLPDGPASRIQYRAATTERNDVDVFAVTDTTVRIVDVAAVLTPGPGCASSDAHTVTCTAVGPSSVDVFAGDLDDIVESQGPQIAADGGAGADVLRGGAGHDLFEGGKGDDHLYGNGESDGLKGGPGNDRLSGGPGDDGLSGGLGDDRLLGGRGPDSIYGDEGLDVLRGGSGHDHLESGSASCGDGTDTVYPSSERDLLRRNCERASWRLPSGPNYEQKGIDLKPYPVQRRADSLTFAGFCPYGDSDGLVTTLPLRGTVTLAARGRTIGKAGIPRRDCAFESDPQQSARFTVRVALTRRGRRLLADARPTDVTVAFAGRNVPRYPWLIRLR